MIMSHILEFFKMGGYAFYVWPAYAIVLSVLLGNWFLARRAHLKIVNKNK